MAARGGAPTAMLNFALSLLVLTTLALTGGAFVLRHRQRKQALLMLVLAGILAANVVIWTLPTPSGATLAAATPR